jgi:acylphosphatase
MTMKRIVVSVQGRVQGVGYRYFVNDYAQQNPVTGYVRNMPDGSVEVVAEGTEKFLVQFIRYIYAVDDPFIRVDNIVVDWGISTGEFSGFEIRR